MPRKPLILVGGGGHCRSCIDVIESTSEWEIEGILDSDARFGERVLSYPVIGNDKDIDKLIEKDYFFFITIGQIKSAATRENVYQNLKMKNARIATVISANAIVSKHAEIGGGTIIHHACVVNAGVVIGENNIINTCANVDHDVRVGSNNHISTHSVLNGGVRMGNGCFIGSGAIIGNGVGIADHVIIGAGSLVLKNIEHSGIYAGSPARRLSQ